MRFVALLLAAVAGASALTELEAQQSFTRFVAKYNKAYEHESFFAKYNTFKANLEAITKHNEGNHSYTMGVNEFADLNTDEFREQYLGLNYINKEFSRSKNEGHLNVISIPDELNWIEKGAVMPIKNQGQCGSCWAFSAVASIEGSLAINSGKLTGLSEQQLVDCSGSYGNMGCNGGLMDSAFEFIMSNGGICAETDYSYTGRDGTCKKTCDKVATVVDYKNVPARNENALLQAIATQPVSVAIQADQMAFQFYSGGVFDAPCGTSLNHGVTAVGYGTEGGKDYYLVRNSWGGSWGVGGYIKMIRNKNQCGISQMSSYAVAKAL